MTSESDLCSDFAAWCRRDGFVVYPEVADWDLLLTKPDHWDRRPKYRPGAQIGIQAKLIGNMRVLAQALDLMSRSRRPLYSAVLVDRADDDFLVVAARLHLPVFYRTRRGRTRRAKWVENSDGYRLAGDLEEGGVAFALELPPIVPDLPAGVPHPRELTPWRVKALRLCEIMRRVGYLTPGDFKVAGVDRRIWVRKWVRPATTCGACRDRGRIERGGETCKSCGGVPKRYLPLGAELPDVGWESVTEQMRKEGKL